MLLQWANDVSVMGFRAAKAPNNASLVVTTLLMDVNKNMSEIQDLLRLPVPFQYFHLLAVMVSVNMLIWAYGMGLTTSVLIPIVFVFLVLIFVGMMVLASQLADPFGEDEVDFPIRRWVDEFIANQLTLVEDEMPEYKTQQDKDSGYSPWWKEIIKSEGQLNWKLTDVLG